MRDSRKKIDFEWFANIFSAPDTYQGQLINQQAHNLMQVHMVSVREETPNGVRGEIPEVLGRSSRLSTTNL